MLSTRNDWYRVQCKDEKKSSKLFELYYYMFRFYLCERARERARAGEEDGGRKGEAELPAEQGETWGWIQDHDLKQRQMLS